MEKCRPEKNNIIFDLCDVQTCEAYFSRSSDRQIDRKINRNINKKTNRKTN